MNGKAENVKEHVHLFMDEVISIAGFYRIEKEGSLEIDGREVLYSVGIGVVDSSCCGSSGCLFADVAGYLLKFHAKRDDRGRWVSYIEPIHDQDAKRRIQKVLEDKEMIQQIRFE